MFNEETINWLIGQGGPAIQLRLSNLQIGKKSKKEIENIVLKLQNIEEVVLILNYLDGFKTEERDIKTFEHLIHYYKDTCIENYFPLILDLGFRAGMSIFDEKMKFAREIFKYFLLNSKKYHYCYNLLIQTHKFFQMAGYTHPEVIKSLEERLDFIHHSAKEKIFDIYQDENKLPKKPKIWTDVGVIKDELSPWNIKAEKPLPTIYDIQALAYYSDICNNPEKIKKIDDIVKYILDPKFQKIREGYGLLWVESRKIYHACGWSPTLHFYDNQNGEIYLIDDMDFMSKFKIAHKSKWFKNCLSYFEQFKTERGTYIFPKEYLHKKYIDKAFLSETNMQLKRKERDLLKRELISTLKMIEIYKRII